MHAVHARRRPPAITDSSRQIPRPASPISSSSGKHAGLLVTVSLNRTNRKLVLSSNVVQRFAGVDWDHAVGPSPLLLALLLRLACARPRTAADIARAIRENSFDRDECYRVRDLTLVKEDIRLYFTDGHLIFSKPVAGRRIAAVFTADVEGGDGEVILLPPDRGERRVARATTPHSPNLDEHFRAALLLFTGDEYEQLRSSSFPNNPGQQEGARDRRAAGRGMDAGRCAISAPATRRASRST